MTKDAWECDELSAAPPAWILATENGWGALVVWAAGRGHFVRVRRAPRDRYGSTIHRRHDGSERREPFLLNEADLAVIDDDIDSFLADAGISPRPRGFDWFIRPPARKNLVGDAFWGAVWEAATSALPDEGLHPARMKRPVKEALVSMYRD
jgi:hypothetical protein